MSSGTLIENCPDLITPVYQAYEKKIKNFPCRANRASECGHPCEKYLVLCRTAWDKKLLHEVEVNFIFQGGRYIERMIAEDLELGGFDVVEQSRPYFWKEFDITGKIDFKVRKKGADYRSPLYPVEGKGLQAFDFDRLNSIEDFLESKKLWIQKYPTQLVLYMLMDNIEYGAFYIKRIPKFTPKQIWVQLDYTFAEDILKKIERVNKHVKEETLPDGINNPDICKYCGFLHICLPDMVGKEVEVLDEISIEEAIKRCEELKPLVSEYNELEKYWKKAVEGKENVIVGDYVVIGKWVKRKGFTVEDSQYWKSEIIVKPDKKQITENVD